jgi:hypothetical protein
VIGGTSPGLWEFCILNNGITLFSLVAGVLTPHNYGPKLINGLWVATGWAQWLTG